MHSRVLTQLLSGGLPVPTWATAIGVVGCVLWSAAYVTIIVTCFRQRTYGVPLVAICLNITWEILASFFWPNPVLGYRIADHVWLLLDCVIFSQLLLYGRQAQTLALLQRYFFPVVAGTVVLAFLGQWTFTLTFYDPIGFVVAFMINLGMSICFIFLALNRPDLRGLSFTVAWLKMLGTLCESIMAIATMPVLHPQQHNLSFYYFMYGAILLFDCLYIGLLWKLRRAAQALSPQDVSVVEVAQPRAAASAASRV